MVSHVGNTSNHIFLLFSPSLSLLLVRSCPTVPTGVCVCAREHMHTHSCVHTCVHQCSHSGGPEDDSPTYRGMCNSFPRS